jgi:hypothetical protein
MISAIVLEENLDWKLNPHLVPEPAHEAAHEKARHCKLTVGNSFVDPPMPSPNPKIQVPSKTFKRKGGHKSVRFLFLPSADNTQDDNLELPGEKKSHIEEKLEDSARNVLLAEITDLKNKLREEKMLFSKLNNTNNILVALFEDKSKFKFYTGLQKEHFNILWKFLGPASFNLKLPNQKGIADTKIEPRQQLILTLIRLRMDFPLQDMKHRYHLCTELISRIYNTWIQFMYVKFSELKANMFVKREFHKPLPKAFQNPLLRNTRIVLDCTEFMTESSRNLSQQGNMFSSYKHHTTCKVLIGVAPSGACMFVSDVYEGSISDKRLITESGFLEHLDKNDVVLADRGFTIEESVIEKGAKLVIPPDCRKNEQGEKGLTSEETVQTKVI